MTKRSVLERYPNTLLLEVLAEGPSHDGEYFLDRDARHFDIVLNFLRDGPERFLRPQDEQIRTEVAHEAEQLRLDVLWKCLRQKSTVHVAPAPVRSVACEDKYLGAPLPSNEAERLAYLRSLNIVDTDEHESKYDAITKAVSALMEVPIVLVSLVEEHKQWFKSRCGLEANSTPRCTSFCAFTFIPEDPSTAAVLVIEDTYRDARVARNPLVLGEPFIRFYAGCPLVSSNGLRLGTLCVMGGSPRTCTPAEAQMLCNFANLVVQEIERESLLQKPSILLDSSILDAVTLAGFTSGPLRQMRMKAALSEVVLLVWASHKSMTWPVLYASEQWTELSGLHVVPSSHVRRRPEPSAVFRGSTRVEDLSLWNCIHLQTCSSEAIEALWQWVQEGTAPYAVEGTIPRTVAGKAKSVMCRLSPVSIPLDVNAASVKCGPSLTSNHSSQSPRPSGWHEGCLVFAVVSLKANRCEEVKNVL